MIDNWGILIYSLGNFDTPIGILGLGSYKWTLNNDNRGNLTLMSEYRGSSALTIFKIHRQ